MMIVVLVVGSAKWAGNVVLLMMELLRGEILVLKCAVDVFIELDGSFIGE